jgi:Fe-S-cluster-containing dehydrogenase component
MSEIPRRSVLKGLAAAGAALAVTEPAEAAVEARGRGRKPDDVGLLYDSNRCIGCRACVTKCKEANDLLPDKVEIDGADYNAPLDLSATTKNIIRLARDGAHGAFVKGGCMHCLDPACVNACMVSALTKIAGGIVAYAENLCVGDRYCQVACPFNVPKYEWSKALAPRMVKCELCRHRSEGPACAEVCPRQAIVTGKVDDLLAEAHRRIARSPQQYHAKVYGEDDAGGTQVLYLAPAAMPFDKLGLPDAGTEPVPELAKAIQHGIYKGFIAPVALYAALGFVVLRNRKRAAGKKEEGQ